ncbi:hypothetical protein Gotri_012323 [Gossypium trilobum]|uniref:RNase H type-1 domain-containing protein n=1 Tax=Gossypium trilobum TaxID=34281 RepID=A0A7J9DPV5_9ROSI|nr:hypothetical protein [Gossypium trilobum]
MKTVVAHPLNNDKDEEYWPLISPPSVGWVKVNVDDSVPKHTSSPAVGGVIWDYKGNWLFGFGMRIGRSGLFQTEARALYERLVAAWHEGFLKWKHVPREQNKVANYIEKMSNEDLNVQCYFVEPPKGVQNLLRNDIQQFGIRSDS